MRRTNHGRKKNVNVFKILLFTLLTFTFLFALVTEVQVVKIKSENKNLNKELTSLKNNNSGIEKENKKLETNITEKKVAYKEKISTAKVAYLTFDDGPSKNTEQILKVLKKYNIKATFFVNGHEELESLYKKISDDGHVLANHTYSHDYAYVYKNLDNFKKDTEKLDKYLFDITGKNPSHILRYPGGSNNTVSHQYGGRNIMQTIVSGMDKDYAFFDWNVDSTDASAFCQNKDKIVSSVLSESKYTKKAVILMHDLNPKVTTVQALPEVIEGLKEQGFMFDKLSKDSFKVEFLIRHK